MHNAERHIRGLAGRNSYRNFQAELLALIDPVPPSRRIRLRTHWRRRILFHVVGCRTANLGSKRHELGLWRISDIASFLM